VEDRTGCIYDDIDDWLQNLPSSDLLDTSHDSYSSSLMQEFTLEANRRRDNGEVVRFTDIFVDCQTSESVLPSLDNNTECPIESCSTSNAQKRASDCDISPAPSKRQASNAMLKLFHNEPQQNDSIDVLLTNGDKSKFGTIQSVDNSSDPVDIQYDFESTVAASVSINNIEKYVPRMAPNRRVVAKARSKYQNASKHRHRCEQKDCTYSTVRYDRLDAHMKQCHPSVTLGSNTLPATL
jgi:hypothetical protein